MIKKHVGIFAQVSPGYSDAGVIKAQERVDQDAQKVQDYYRQYGRTVWDVVVKGYVMRGEQTCHPPYYAQDDIRTYMSEHDMEGFEPNYFHVHGGGSQSYCGQGDVGGNRSVTYSGYTCGAKTMIHELGHNFGLRHANTKSGSDPKKEYGDKGSIMGSVSRITGMNSPHVVRLGLESEREIHRVYDSEQVLICPVEMPKHGMHDNEWQHVIIEKRSKKYHLSLRKSQWMYPDDETDHQTLYVHQDVSDGSSTRFLGDLVPGRSKSIDGMKIEYLEYNNETARVNIFYSASDVIEGELEMPTGFPAALPTVSVEPKHSGSWYDGDFSGQGLDVHVTDDMMLLYWYTYNVNHESPRFYYAACNRTEATKEFKIYTTEGGTWDNPAKHTLIEAGIGQIYFIDDTTGVFNYKTEEHGRYSLEIDLIAKPSDNPLSGAFYQWDRRGEGFTFQFYGNTCVAFWYSNGPITDQRYSGVQTQRWYTADGSKNADGSYALTVYENSGNTWMKVQDTSTAAPVGLARLTPVDNDNIRFDYDIDTGTVGGVGTFQLVRLL